MEDDSAAVSPAASSTADQAVQVNHAVRAHQADQSVRAVTDVETLKALADPIRLSLLSALMRSSGKLPVRSVKELAAQLGEPQTKLYRHVKHLEAADLIRAVSSRVVSGIVEQHYQACQSELILGPFTDDERRSPETEAAVGVLFDLFRSRFFAASRAGLLPAQTSANTETHRKVVLNVTETRVPVAKAAAIRERLQAILDDLDEPSSEPPAADTVQVNLLIGYYSPAEP
jgi:DNA-binding transcriptional ArsR family regulator